jgi:hypothetical protein
MGKAVGSLIGLVLAFLLFGVPLYCLFWLLSLFL